MCRNKGRKISIDVADPHENIRREWGSEERATLIAQRRSVLCSLIVFNKLRILVEITSLVRSYSNQN